MENEIMNSTEVDLNTQPGSKKVVSITEAAKINNVTRQAIYVAIKQKNLKPIKIQHVGL